MLYLVSIKTLAWGLFCHALYCELFQIVIRAVVDIEIHIAIYARQTAGIGVLPELPFALILHLIDVVVGNPVRVSVKTLVGKVLLLELIVGVDDWFHVIAVFHNVQPQQHILLEVLR